MDLRELKSLSEKMRIASAIKVVGKEEDLQTLCEEIEILLGSTTILNNKIKIMLINIVKNTTLLKAKYRTLFESIEKSKPIGIKALLSQLLFQICDSKKNMNQEYDFLVQLKYYLKNPDAIQDAISETPQVAKKTSPKQRTPSPPVAKKTSLKQRAPSPPKERTPSSQVAQTPVPKPRKKTSPPKERTPSPPKERTSSPQVETKPVPKPRTTPVPKPRQNPKFIAMYTYNAQNFDELSFKERDILTILKKNNNGWWEATNSTGKEGIIPSNYVELYVESLAGGYRLKSKSKKNKNKNKNFKSKKNKK